MPNPTPVNPYICNHTWMRPSCAACIKGPAWNEGRIAGSQQGKKLAELIVKASASPVSDVIGREFPSAQDWQAIVAAARALMEGK